LIEVRDGMTHQHADKEVGLERRARASGRFRVKLDPRELRTQVTRSLAELEGLGRGARRRVQVVIGQLITQWLALEGPEGFRAPVFEVLRFDGHLRIDVAADPPGAPRAFWEELVSLAVEEQVTAWGIDRRRPEGVWLELDLSG
jgi:hypothetical protein